MQHPLRSTTPRAPPPPPGKHMEPNNPATQTWAIATEKPLLSKVDHLIQVLAPPLRALLHCWGSLSAKHHRLHYFRGSLCWGGGVGKVQGLCCPGAS